MEVLWLANEWKNGRKPACICFATIRSDHIGSHSVKQKCPFCCLQRAAADLECHFRVRESNNRGMASLAIMVPLGFKYDQSAVRCKDQSIISVTKMATNLSALAACGWLAPVGQETNNKLEKIAEASGYVSANTWERTHDWCGYNFYKPGWGRALRKSECAQSLPYGGFGQWDPQVKASSQVHPGFL